MLFLGAACVWSGETFGAAMENPTAQTDANARTGGTIFINEYRVDGASKLPRRNIEEAVYPFLGPGRTKEDVELARASLEQAYHDKGFQTVAVQVPEQQVKRGIVHLQVVERPVGRLRVKGARYSSLNKIKAMTPSLAEGAVIDFNEVPADIVALNQLPDRQITPSLRAGVAPDTVDVDLEVKEKAPVHASAELNNRHGPDTTALRVNASVSANNLWQAGHGAGFSFQVSPQDTSEVKVFSGYYLARFSHVDWFTLMASATKQDGNVSTLGDIAVAGRGTTVGLRGNFSLPAGKEFSHSASLGLSYKYFNQKVTTAATDDSPQTAPITYYPIDASYAATWQNKRVTTELNAGVAFHLRGTGSDSSKFDDNRYKADANFLIFHGDLAQTRELPAGFQLFGKIQGQIADQPLLSGEQASGGGLGTARGYLEAEAVGDNSVFGSLELRSPSILKFITDKKGDWRFYIFSDAGWLKVNESLPEQKNHFDFLSYGIGSRLRFMDHFDGSIVAAFPQLKVGQTLAHTTRIIFKAEFDY
jgi:hemolysin activation/secretion protein